MRKACLVAIFVLFALPMFAQQPPIAIPGDDLAWSQPCPSCSLADVQGMTYRAYIDGATSSVALTGVSCSGASSPFACVANFPALTTGNHTVQVEPVLVSSTGATLVGEKSDAFAWRLITAVPLKPIALNAVQGQ